jgi:glycosyltransferase involved in cell wall biosynthesis
MLETITPVVLTCNEEPNIGRTLDALRWARTVVVLDSGSTDKTKEIVGGYENVQWFERAFDNHQAQWDYAIRQTGIDTEYVLALDADMQITEAFKYELEEIFLPGNFPGGDVPFAYCYYGRALSGSLYPNQVRVFRRQDLLLTQRDHSQHFAVNGSVYTFRNRVIHDDRKPLERWVAAQVSYQELNEAAIRNGGAARFRDYLRRSGLMPPVMGLFAYFRSGGPFGGAASARYAYERIVCESLLAIRLMNSRLKAKEENVRDSRNN